MKRRLRRRTNAGRGALKYKCRLRRNEVLARRRNPINFWCEPVTDQDRIRRAHEIAAQLYARFYSAT